MNSENKIKELINTIRAEVVSSNPELLGTYEIYANEAAHAYSLILENLHILPSKSKVIEIGAGIMLLSCQLAKDGFDVYALEPISAGFGDFEEIKSIVIDWSTRSGYTFNVYNITVEEMNVENRFSFAYSINVMEHVENVEVAMFNIVRSLVKTGSYRFICPNYLFPYEPHFNLLTFFSKRLTFFILKPLILKSKRIKEPVALWKSLNWINVIDIKKICKKNEVDYSFNKSVFVNSFERALQDEFFASRRSKFIVQLSKVLVRLRVHKLFNLMPETMLPVIDCTINKQ